MQGSKSRFREPFVVAIAAILYLILGALIGAYANQAGYLKSLPSLPGGLFGSRHDSQMQRFSSIFVPLSARTVPIPEGDRNGAGGGLTGFGAHLLLLDFDGHIWLVEESGKKKKLAIQPPENGYKDLVAFADSRAGERFKFDLSLFRYHDIHFAEGDSGDTLFVSYSYFDRRNTCYTNRLASLPVTKSQLSANQTIAPEEWNVIYESSPCLSFKSEFNAIEGHMAGGRIDHDRSRNVVILGNGDYAIDEHYSSIGKLGAQEAGWEYGAVVEINIGDGTSKILSRGHRNIQGVTVDPESGAIWAVEHGMRGGDEVNLIREAANYGWPLVSYGTSYSSLPLQTALADSVGRHDGYEEPEYAFLPSVAVSTSDLIENFHPAWDGDLLIGTLRAGLLVRLRYNHEQERVIFAERISIGARIRDLEVLSGGVIGLWTDARQILFLRPAEQGLAGQYIEHRLANSKLNDIVTNEVSTAFARCSECHSFEPGIHTAAPSLSDVIGREAGKTSFAGYSPSLRDAGFRWDTANLEDFLEDPEAVVPGTNMPRVEMSVEARREMISIISGLSNEVELSHE